MSQDRLLETNETIEIVKNRYTNNILIIIGECMTLKMICPLLRTLNS